MVKFIISTHGKFANGLLESADMLTGNTEKIHVLSLLSDMSANDYYTMVLNKIEEIDEGDGILAMVDLFGGTPSNTLFKITKRFGKRIKIVTGVNLPMVIKVISEIDENDSLEKIAKEVKEFGKDQIMIYQ